MTRKQLRVLAAGLSSVNLSFRPVRWKSGTGPYLTQRVIRPKGGATLRAGRDTFAGCTTQEVQPNLRCTPRGTTVGR